MSWAGAALHLEAPGLWSVLPAWTAAAVAGLGSAWKSAGGAYWCVECVESVESVAEDVAEPRHLFSSSFSSSWMSLSGRARGIRKVAGRCGTWRRKRRKAKSAHDARN